jgi:uncharacterized metal-binding protein YceD (DUF177 family)
MPAIVLPVHDVDELGKDFSFELTADWLDSELADTPLNRATGTESGQLTLHAQQNGVEYLINGQLDVELQVECSRCLGEVPLPIHSSITALLSPRKDGADAQEIELEAEDLDRAYYEGHELVLDELVREHIVIEAPMQPLCSPDCKGIPIPERVLAKDFGGEGAIDPRLAPLNELKAKLSDKNERRDEVGGKNKSKR